MEFRTPRSTRIGTRLTIGAALLVLFAGLGFLGSRILEGPAPTPVPTPRPFLDAESGELRAHPDVPDEIRTRVTSELEDFLTELYERAFLPPLPAPTPGPDDPASPAPTPVPRPPTTALLTEQAAAALGGSPGVYRPAPREAIFRGTVTFDGITVVQGAGATDALLDVTFEARGRLEVEAPDLEEGELGRYHDLRLEQTGELQLIRTADGWRVSGFDLELRSEELIPASPRPEAAAYRVARGRSAP